MKYGVFSPSSRLNDSSLDDAMKRCIPYNASFEVHPQTYLEHHQSAGLPTDKVKALNSLMSHHELDAIWTSIGGNRAATMLDHLDKIDLTSITKPLIGFSDLTILLNAFYTLTGQVNIHGPGLQSLNNPRITDHDLQELISLVQACVTQATHQITFKNCSCISNDQTRRSLDGTIIGGNLSVFQALIGTPFMPKNVPFILFLEDIGDHLSRYDRMLRHLKHSGLYDQCCAILLGDFGVADDNGRTAFGFTLDDILNEHFAHFNIPVFKDLSFGHRGEFTPLPVGAHTKITHDLNNRELHLSFDFKA